MNLKLFLPVLAIILMGCQSNNSQSDNSATDSNVQKLENLNWLPGNWIRLNDDEGRQTYETWTKTSDQLITGLGYTLVGEDTIFKEDLSITFKEGKVNYIVKGVNPEPTHFEFIGQSENAFACANPENEFPTNIEYIYQNDTIFATIMGGSNSIVFVFVRE